MWAVGLVGALLANHMSSMNGPIRSGEKNNHFASVHCDWAKAGQAAEIVLRSFRPHLAHFCEP